MKTNHFVLKEDGNQVQEKTYTREEVRELIYQAFFANSCGRKAGDVHEYFLRWFDENVKP